MKGVGGGFGERSCQRRAAAADGEVEGGVVGGDGAGAGGGDDGRLGLLEEPLDGLAVGLVAQFTGELEDTGGAGGGHADAATAAVDLGVAVFGGAFWGDSELFGEGGVGYGGDG